MSSGPSLTSEGEAAWLRFKQHLDWNEGFALVFLFAAHPEVTEIFRHRLADIHRAMVTGLAPPMPTQPQGLLDELLPQLLAPPQHRRALRAPSWIDLSGPLDEDWRKARLAFLVRLNEQRETLRRETDQALILVLPLAERTLVKSLVPDLWAIRHFSLNTEDWLVREPAVSLPPPPSPSVRRFPQASASNRSLKNGDVCNAGKAKTVGICSRPTGQSLPAETAAISPWLRRLPKAKQQWPESVVRPREKRMKRFGISPLRSTTSEEPLRLWASCSRRSAASRKASTSGDR